MAIIPPNRYTPGSLQKPTQQSPNIYGAGGSRPSGGYGMQQGPTPWWQTSQGAGDRVGNLSRSAPSGYEYDPVQMGYVRTARSAPTEQKMQERQVRYEDEDRQRRLALQSSLAGRLSGAMGGLQAAGGYGQTSMPTGTSPAISFPQVSMGAIPDASAAQGAAFGAAKAKAGAMGRSAVDSLRSELAERGIMGGGTEARGLADRLAAATNPLSDINVAQQAESLTDVRRAQELGAQRAAQQYTGGIAQRGQDIQNQQAQAQLAQQRQLEQMRLLQQALAGLSASY